MSFFTFLATAFAAVVALVSGISSMASDSEGRHFDSVHGMEVPNNIVRNARLLFPLQ